MCLERLRIGELLAGIQIVRLSQHRIGIKPQHLRCISIEERTVGFQMNQSIRLDYLLVSLHEISGSQALGGLFHLRVAERDPYLIHFVFGKKSGNDLYVRTQESDVFQSVLFRFFRARPHARSFYIHAYEVLVRVSPRQTDRVFTASAAQLQYNRMVVMEIRFPPASGEFIDYRPTDDLTVFIQTACTALEDIGERLHFGKLFQFILAHFLFSFTVKSYTISQ